MYQLSRKTLLKTQRGIFLYNSAKWKQWILKLPLVGLGLWNPGGVMIADCRTKGQYVTYIRVILSKPDVKPCFGWGSSGRVFLHGIFNKHIVSGYFFIIRKCSALQPFLKTFSCCLWSSWNKYRIIWKKKKKKPKTVDLRKLNSLEII